MAVPTERPNLWLVRHGETDWARLGRHTGRTDIPLTERGRSQARAVAAKLADATFLEVLSSPLSRALDTSHLAGFADRATTDADLLEWDYGRLEGMTTPEIREQDPGWTIWRGKVPGGEVAADVAARVDSVISRVRRLDGDGDVLAFAHGHLLRVLAARWLGLPPEDGGLFALATATVSVLGWEHGEPVVERWNEACG